MNLRFMKAGTSGCLYRLQVKGQEDRFVNLRFMKAGTSDALVLNSISKQAFDSDAEVGAASRGGPPGYQSVSFHVKMARMNHLFKLADENGVILGGAILFRQGDTLNIGRIFIDPHGCLYRLQVKGQEDRFVNLRFMKAGTSDALVLNSSQKLYRSIKNLASSTFPSFSVLTI